MVPGLSTGNVEEHSRSGGRTGVLYVVSTPIGNLEDMTHRAVRVLGQVRLIAAEDTRHTRKLLDHYGIRTPLTSLHGFNEHEKSEGIVRKLQEGLDVAYVSDAGTPGISDPGYLLVNRAVAAGIRVVPVPGASAVVAALSVSGLPTEKYVFHGFLPSPKGKRRAFLASLRGEEKTMVFYESPRRLRETLADIAEVLGDRPIVVARELTKTFEEVIRGTVSEAAAQLGEGEVRGEITLIVSGAREPRPEPTDEEIRARAAVLLADGSLSRRDVADIVSREMDVPRKRVYRLVLFP
ncbi:MAG: Ribosomal RNA small subunit methyltransferase I [Syntrophaceae bacterium PtaU1.Bin231]|nr:MAG: Ribosomal RNA small subunit methyltransferase I [Syntrophaceae bacterium PtaU1.Bin231]